VGFGSGRSHRRDFIFAAGFALVASSTHLPGYCSALGYLPPTVSALPGLDLPAAVGPCVDFTVSSRIVPGLLKVEDGLIFKLSDSRLKFF
jgi:hypothetical protein